MYLDLKDDPFTADKPRFLGFEIKIDSGMDKTKLLERMKAIGCEISEQGNGLVVRDPNHVPITVKF